MAATPDWRIIQGVNHKIACYLLYMHARSWEDLTAFYDDFVAQTESRYQNIGDRQLTPKEIAHLGRVDTYAQQVAQQICALISTERGSGG